MNGIIYCIKNLKTGKCYVGQSTYKFTERYYKGNWSDKTHNSLLKADAAYYGLNNFEVKILEFNVESIEELNELEEKYASEFNCYYPNGYNFARCGNNKRMNDLTKEKLRLAHKRKTPLEIKRISDQQILKIDNLCKFCKDNNLNRGNLTKMIYNRNYDVRHLESQGYCLPETTLEQLNSITINKYLRKTYRFKNID